MSEQSVPEGLALSNLDPGYRADPHSRLDVVRGVCPVQWDQVAGSYRLLSYADVRAVVSNRGLWRDPDKAEAGAVFYKNARKNPPGLNHPEDPQSNVILLDDPDHSRVRKALGEAFNKRVAQSETLVQAAVAKTLAELPESGGIELISSFCVPIPIRVMAGMFGIEDSLLGEFRLWSEGAVQLFNPARTPELTVKMVKAHNDASAYFDEAMRVRRKSPRDDLISDLVAAQARTGEMSDADIRFNCLILLAAGNLTTTDLIGMAVYYTLSSPEAKAQVWADKSKIRLAIEETLRIAPSIEQTVRIASSELTVGNQTIRQGACMLISLIAANHDPAVFLEPHKFDISRGLSPHVAFGGGAHACIGAALARMEANVALTALFGRYPALKLLDEVPRWRSLHSFRGLEALNLTLA